MAGIILKENALAFVGVVTNKPKLFYLGKVSKSYDMLWYLLATTLTRAGTTIL